MKQLSSLDTQFLHVESATTTGHVGGLLILDPTTSHTLQDKYKSCAPGQVPGSGIPHLRDGARPGAVLVALADPKQVVRPT